MPVPVVLARAADTDAAGSIQGRSSRPHHSQTGANADREVTPHDVGIRTTR